MTLISSGVNTKPVNQHTPPHKVAPPVESITLEEDLKSSLPNLDQTEDPRGAAVVWALLVTGTALLVGMLSVLNWTASTW
jgi:hypothetical protein